MYNIRHWGIWKRVYVDGGEHIKYVQHGRNEMLDHKDFLITLQDLKDLRAEKKGLEDQVKDVNKAIQEAVYDCVEYMEESDHLSVKIDGLGLCSLTSTKKYSIEDPFAFESWMKAQGDMDLIMAVHAQKVHGYYKERLDNNEELPPGIKTFIKNNITIRGG